MFSSPVRRCAALFALLAATSVLSDDSPKPSDTPQVKSEPTAEQRIRHALDSRQPFECKDLLISELPALLQKQYKIPVVLDALRIEEAGKIELRLSLATQDASLRSCLAVLLRPHDLDFIISNEAMVLTTREIVASTLRTEVLAVGDLTAASATRPSGLPLDDDRPWDEDSLVELIISTIVPPSWDAAGGAGNLKVYRDFLAVSQIDETIEHVKKLLTALRAAKAHDRNVPPEQVSIDLFNPAARRLRLALDQAAALSVKDQPLEDVMRTLASKHQLPLRLDGTRLEEAGKDPTQILVSVDLADVSLRSLLHHVLTPHELGIVVRDEHIWLTTRETDAAALDVRVYPVRDLIATTDNAEDYDWLKELIITTVQPATWAVAGGPGSIREFEPAGALVFAQTDSVHADVARLIARLREVRRDAGAARKPNAAETEGAMVIRFYRIDFASDVPSSGVPPAESKRSPDVAAEVVNLVRNLVEPESWKKEPQTYLRAIGDRLVVRHRRAVHLQIERLIEKLNAAPTPLPSNNQIPMGSGGAAF